MMGSLKHQASAHVRVKIDVNNDLMSVPQQLEGVKKRNSFSMGTPAEREPHSASIIGDPVINLKQ